MLTVCHRSAVCLPPRRSIGFRWFAGQYGLADAEQTAPTIINSDGHAPAVAVCSSTQSTL